MTQPALGMAARLVAGFESFEPRPYLDSGQTWTIAYGTTLLGSQPVGPDTPPCTREQGLAWLMAHLADDAAHVDWLAPKGATDNERAACYSFAYNEGWPAFAGSTLLRLWKSNGPAATAAEWGRWIYVSEGGVLVPSNGLKIRRAKEKAVFFGEQTP